MIEQDPTINWGYIGNMEIYNKALLRRYITSLIPAVMNSHGYNYSHNNALLARFSCSTCKACERCERVLRKFSVPQVHIETGPRSQWGIPPRRRAWRRSWWLWHTRKSRHWKIPSPWRRLRSRTCPQLIASSSFPNLHNRFLRPSPASSPEVRRGASKLKVTDLKQRNPLQFLYNKVALNADTWVTCNGYLSQHLHNFLVTCLVGPIV